MTKTKAGPLYEKKIKHRITLFATKKNKDRKRDNMTKGSWTNKKKIQTAAHRKYVQATQTKISKQAQSDGKQVHKTKQ